MKRSRKTHACCCLSLGLGAVTCGLPAVQAADAAAAPADPNPTGWKSSAFLGATVTKGNSDTMMINGSAKTDKKWDKNELSFGADLTYGKDHSNVNANSVSGFGQYNRLFTDRFYGYARVDALHDEIADINYRVTLGPGAGYYFLKNDKFTLSGEAGPGLVMEKVANQCNNYWTVRLAEKFTWKISERSRLWEGVDYQPQVDDLGNYVVNAELGAESDLTKHLALRVVFADTYRSRPAPGKKDNDLKLMAGLAYRF
jgi:putative salt-induced outer membrane protein YdiY